VKNEGVKGVLFFDGACGMCTRCVNFLLRHDRTGTVITEPLQSAGAADRLRVPEDRLLEAMRWLDPSGAVYTGAEAWAAAWSAALGNALPLRVYRPPGIRFIQDAVYGWVAGHRYRFRGTTPYCEAHPVAC
jgi:predicted DCC family thiol-disulfide oxidoreductase YuxK